MRRTVAEALDRAKLMFIFRGGKLSDDDLKRACQAVLDGGGRLVELTYNHNDDRVADTPRAMALLHETFGDDLLIGSGTTLNVDEVRMAREAGASFVVAPVLNRSVIEEAARLDLMCMPGAGSATEALQAHEWGADYVKLFPAGEMGIGYAKALMAPLGFIKYFAVCRMTPEYFEECLRAGFAGAGVSSCINAPELITSGAFDEIERRVATYVDIAARY